MKCLKCAAENKDTAKFCSSCGSSISQATDLAPPASAICPACNHENKANAKFCAKCAFHLTGASAVPAPVTPAPDSAARLPDEAAAPLRAPDAPTRAEQPRIEISAESAPERTVAPPVMESTMAGDLPTKTPAPNAVESPTPPGSMETSQPDTPRDAASVIDDAMVPAQENTGQPAAGTGAQVGSTKRMVGAEASRIEPTNNQGNGARIALAAAVALVIAGGAGGWWWHSKKSGDLPPAVASGAPPSVNTPPASLPPATTPDLHGNVASAPASAAANPVEPAPAPAEPPVQADKSAPLAQVEAAKEPPAPNADSTQRVAQEKSDAEKAEQLAKRKAAEEARKRKAEEAKARAQAHNKPVQPTLLQAPARAEPPPAHAAARDSTTQERVAQCQKENLLKRELCMWQVCSNKWGQDGCPAYKAQSTPSY